MENFDASNLSKDSVFLDDKRDKLVVLGGGSSINFYPNLFDDIMSQDIMTVNYSYRFVLSIPKYQASIDHMFWKNNLEDMAELEKEGCILINRRNELPISKIYNETDFFCGSRKLSGVFALDYAVRKLKYKNIFLFGYDFGPIDGKTHYYDGIKFSGNGKISAYLDEYDQVLHAVKDFDNFNGKNSDIFLVGQSNIKSFPRLTYDEFLKKLVD